MVRILLALALSLLAGGIASAEVKDRAEVRALPGGGEALFVDGALAWPTDKRRVAISAGPRWAATGHAVAIVGRTPKRSVLVVVVVDGRAAGQAVEWTVPERIPARVVMWLGPRRVGVGAEELVPQMVTRFDLVAE